MITRIAIAIAITILCTAAESAAQTIEPEEAPRRVYARRSVIHFGEVTVSGEVTRPSGSYVQLRKKTRFQPLVRLRSDFRPELLASVDAL